MLGTHLLSLSVATEDNAQWSEVYETLTGVGMRLGERGMPYVNVSSHVKDDDYEETEGFTEATLHKVYQALSTTGLNDDQIDMAINEMQNAGILFRERV